jgi:hypothetical protein
VIIFVLKGSAVDFVLIHSRPLTWDREMGELVVDRSLCVVIESLLLVINWKLKLVISWKCHMHITSMKGLSPP